MSVQGCIKYVQLCNKSVHGADERTQIGWILRINVDLGHNVK